MRIKTIIDEDFVNYKQPVMYIGTAQCNGKCCLEAGIPLSVCQNDGWHESATIEMADDKIIQRYLSNDITKAICFAGLEPFEQFDEMAVFIKKLRNDYHCNDTVIIYTGFYKNEVLSQIQELQKFKNIIIKFGRYVPDKERHFDEILGVYLASNNQYAEVVS